MLQPLLRLLGLILCAMCVWGLAMPTVSLAATEASKEAAQLAAAKAKAAQQLETWKPLIDRLVADGVDRAFLEKHLSRPEAVFTPEPMVDKLLGWYHSKFGSELTREIQRHLIRLHYKKGRADSFHGPETRQAVRRYEHVHNMPITGKASLELLAMLEADKKRAPDKIVLPPPPKGPRVYRTIATEERKAEAVAFYKENQAILSTIEEKYGVPPYVTTGLLTVETRVGKFLGNAPAFQTLASMAMSRDVQFIMPAFERDNPQGPGLAWLKRKAKEKGDWAYKEFKALIVYAERANKDVLSIPGSIYGAIGLAQFMPTNALRYGVDGNNDGVVDLFTWDDALHSMGNFLKGHGWRGAKTRAKLRKVLFRYNPSTTYVNTILHIADHVKAKTAT